MVDLAGLAFLIEDFGLEDLMGFGAIFLGTTFLAWAAGRIKPPKTNDNDTQQTSKTRMR